MSLYTWPEVIPQRLTPMIDAHVHLDMYEESAREQILKDLSACGIEGVISVSMHLDSCLRNQALASEYPGIIHPAYGYHPEQPVLSEEEMSRLLDWMEDHVQEMVAVGEIGLPYYSRKEALKNGKQLDYAPYIRMLERFMQFAGSHDKPVVLHAVYEDAELACDLLEQYGIRKAHFHWFKGSEACIRRMAARGYYISITPDVLYEKDIADLAASYPAELIMAETDGPWPHEGPYSGTTTHPVMVHDIAAAWADLRGMTSEEAARMLYQNTRRFYAI